MKRILSILIPFLLTCSNVSAQDTWGAFKKTISAAGYEGQPFKLTGAIRTKAGEGGMAMLWFRVDRKEKKRGFFDNMEDRPVNNSSWGMYSISGVIDADADSLNFGGLMVGNGEFYYDDFALSVQNKSGQWINIPIANHDFETNNEIGGLPEYWSAFHPNAKMRYFFTPMMPYAGKYCLLVLSSGIEEDGATGSYLKMSRFLKQNYNKSEYQIAMRDGTKLFTVVYAPKDASPANKYPMILNRTPYSVGPYGADKFTGHAGPPELVTEKYIFVKQDVRGRYMSEGVWTNMTPNIPNKKTNKDVDESTDTYDAIDWLVKNIPNNNGRVGQYGISYPGFYSSAGSINAHPALKAVSPQAPIADFFWDDFHHNGAFTQGYFWNFPIFGTAAAKPSGDDWWTLFDKPTPDGYDFYKRNGTLKELGDKYYKDNFLWKEVSEHPNYDTFWQQRRIVKYLRNVKPAYLVVGGWFDAEDLYGALTTYKEIEKNNPGAYNVITMGPFGHGDWAGADAHYKHHDIYFGDSLQQFFQKNIEAKFFKHFLKENGDANAGLPEAYMFNTGKKAYEQFAKWPPANAHKQKLYFSANEKLSMAAPSGGFDEYVSDPNKPVPYTMDIEGSFDITPRNYMSEDQRFASSRPDVLVYETDVLTDDITLGGEIMAKLNISTTGSDADWVVKLIDVYPGNEKNSEYTPKGLTLAGYQQLVRSEIMRSRFRNSFEKPEALTPNAITPINFPLQDVLHTFKKGHRIMVQVQSTWFPAFDRNPQQFVPNIYKADAKDFIKATQRVYHDNEHPSYLEVDVL